MFDFMLSFLVQSELKKKLFIVKATFIYSFARSLLLLWDYLCTDEYSPFLHCQKENNWDARSLASVIAFPFYAVLGDCMSVG